MAFPLSDAEHAAIKRRIENQPELIVAAAILVPLPTGDVILTAERPGRHGDLICYAGKLSGDRMRGGEQGFLTNRGRFVDRALATKIARDAGQATDRDGCNGQMFSEDMWNDWDVLPTADIDPATVF